MIERFARPYADALLSASGSVEALQTVREELGAFSSAMQELPALSQMVSNPGIPREAKQATLTEISTKLGLGSLASKTLNTLLNNGRLAKLPEVLSAVDQLLDRKLGVQRALITSASELSADQSARLKELLEKSLGSKVELEVSVDPSLLGGFVAQVGSERYDVSLKGEIDRMADHLADSAGEAATA